MRAMIGLDLVRKLPARDLDIRDTKLTGFVVRCRASGAHSYRVQLGRGRWLTIGAVGVLAPHEAREAARQALADVTKGGDPMVGRRRGAPTWARYVTDTYAPWAEENRKTGAGTVARLRAIFAEFDDVPLTDVSGFAIEKWRSAKLKAGAKPATVNRDLAALRGAVTKAREWKLLTTNPLADVKAAHVDAIAHVRFLSDDEETRLREALEARDDRRREARDAANRWRRERGYGLLPALGAYTDHLTPIVLLALNTGCRRGELFSLTWGDVDLLAGRMTVRAESSKSGLSRVLPLNAEALGVLRAWRPAPAPSSAYVFPGDDGARMQGLKTAWHSLMKAAQIEDFRFHDCRHSFASRLVQAGVDLNRVRALLGHADTKMVMRYAHLRDTDLAAAVAKLGHNSR
jgi:integrase